DAVTQVHEPGLLRDPFEYVDGERARHGLVVPPARSFGSRARTATRIASTGAGRPVQSSKLFAPWRTSASRPSITSHPAARAAATSAVSVGSSIEYARSITTWPRCGSTSRSSRTGVAFTIRSQPSALGGHAPERV